MVASLLRELCRAGLGQPLRLRLDPGPPLVADAGHLASAAGLVPVPRDFDRRTGNLHRPKRYSRRLRWVFHMAAQASIIGTGPNRDFYLKKRAEGCRHVQAVIALARRRVDVRWALLRDNRTFSLEPPSRPT